MITERCPPPSAHGFREADSETELLLAERIEYLEIVGSVVAADGQPARGELELLLALCIELGLPERETRRVLERTRSGQAGAARSLHALQRSPLGFSLLADCLSIALAEVECSTRTRTAIRALARSLGVDDAELWALEAAVLGARLLRQGPAALGGYLRLVERFPDLEGTVDGE
jgi:hypothetical protein